MYGEVLQVLCARLSLDWLNSSFQGRAQSCRSIPDTTTPQHHIEFCVVGNTLCGDYLIMNGVRKRTEDLNTRHVHAA
jgi:hypothetical protein